MFINQFKIQLIIALCCALFRSRISGACQPVSSARENSLSRDRSELVRRVFISAQRPCLLEWRHSRLPSCPLCKELHVHPWVKWLHISDVWQWWFSPPWWVVTLDCCQAGLFMQLWGKANSALPVSAGAVSCSPRSPPLRRFNPKKTAFLVSF